MDSAATMVCLYCGERLPLLRDLALGEFCSAAHGELFERLQHEFEEAESAPAPASAPPVSLRGGYSPRDRKLDRAIRITPLGPATLAIVNREVPAPLGREPKTSGRIPLRLLPAEPGYIGTITRIQPGTFARPRVDEVSLLGNVRSAAPRGRVSDHLLHLATAPVRQARPQPLSRAAMVRPLPEAMMAPLHVPLTDNIRAIRPARVAAAPPSRRPPAMRLPVHRMPWRSLAVAASFLIVMVALARGWQPLRAAQTQAGVAGWERVKKNIANRAAINMVDDFRAGLDSWTSRHRNMGWAYDRVGFIRPAALAIYDPSRKLTDYSVEFLAQLRSKGIGVAVRAADLNNYYAVRLVVVTPGPMPQAQIVRYPVIGGHEGPHVTKPLPVTIRPDALFHARILARGDEFTLMVQDQIVDFWSDTRFSRGGVGFFCLRGDDARLRWVEITHHDDTLGRLCALIAPYNVAAANGSWEK